MILLDTCALLWWTLEPHQLSEKAHTICSKIETDGAFISSISIWEIAIKIKKGSLDIKEDARAFTNRLELSGVIEIVPVNEKIWLKNVELEWDHRDAADRTIVATAILRDLPILTKDKIIHDYYKRAVW